MTTIYIPDAGNAPSEAEVWRWYLNIEKEFRSLDLTETERSCMRAYYSEAGLLRRWRRRFFRRHYARPVRDVIAFFFSDASRPVVLDLGCGVGTQSLLFALLGASVIAVDMDTVALGVLRKRQALYERLSGRTLSIRCSAENALSFDYAESGPIECVFSMFAFNMMQPSDVLLDRILKGSTGKVRIGILDGNNRSWLARLVPSRRRRVWSPQQFGMELARRGFSVASHRGAVSLPPMFWNLAPFSILEPIDARMNDNWFFPISHLVLAERQ